MAIRLLYEARPYAVGRLLIAEGKPGVTRARALSVALAPSGARAAGQVQGRFDNPSTIVAHALAWERTLTARRVSYAVAGAWCCGMMPTMLNVDQSCRSQVRTPKWGNAASESLVSTIVTLDPETAISYESVW